MIRSFVFILCLLPLFRSLPAAQAPTAPPESQPDRIIARVDNEPITERQVLTMIDQIAASQQLPPEQQLNKTTRLFSQAVERLIILALLRKEAGEKGITADKERVEKEFQEIIGRYPSREAFEKALAQHGMKEEQLRSEVEQNTLFQTTIELRLAGLPEPAEEQIQKFYEEQGQAFTEPPMVHAAHILLRAEENAAAEKKAELRQKLDDVRVKIESGELGFEAAAADYSEDPSNAKKGGDLGFFPRGRMVQPFEDTAFATEAGKLSQVIETRFGFHLIRVLEHKPGGKLPYEKARDMIRGILRNQAQQGEIQKFIAELRAKAKIEQLVSEEEWAKLGHP